MNCIIAIGLVQALLAAALLWQGPDDRPGRSALTALMLCIAVHLGIKFSIYTMVTDGAVRSQMNTCIGFCYGPLMLLHRDQLLRPATGLRRWYLFLPAVFALVGYLTVISVITVSNEIGHLVLQRYNAATAYLIPLMNAVCAASCIRSVRVRSDRTGLRLLHRLALLLGVACVVPAAASLALELLPLPAVSVRSLAYLIIAAMPLTVIWELATATGRQPDWQPAVVADHPVAAAAVVAVVPELPAPVEMPAAGETQRLAIPTDTGLAASAALLNRVEELIRTSELLSDPDLNLDRLARSAGATRHQLSEMLNRYAGKSFYDFINQHRVDRTVQKMAELVALDIPVNILVLAYDNGFKAKSSFNAAFRKITGITPSAYLEQIRAGQAQPHFAQVAAVPAHDAGRGFDK